MLPPPPPPSLSLSLSLSLALAWPSVREAGGPACGTLLFSCPALFCHSRFRAGRSGASVCESLDSSLQVLFTVLGDVQRLSKANRIKGICTRSVLRQAFPTGTSVSQKCSRKVGNVRGSVGVGGGQKRKQTTEEQLERGRAIDRHDSIGVDGSLIERLPIDEKDEKGVAGLPPFGSPPLLGPRPAAGS